MTQSQKHRLTIGFLTERLDVAAAYTSIILSGAMAAAEKHHVNLLVIPGDNLSHNPARDPSEARRKILFDLISAENLDGVIILGLLGNFGPPHELMDFHKRYQPIPTVSIGTPLQGVTSIVVDNEKGLHDAISHLIEVHGRKKIAFICGPETAQDAQTRYQVYTRTLAEHGLPVDPNLVAPGLFTIASGTAAIQYLLDERQASFDALVAANDLMAVGAMEELQARDFLVPEQIAIAGFDNDGYSQVSIPSLTTVRQPMVSLGEQAVLKLLDKIAGKASPEIMTLPTEAVIRQSCGCWDPLVNQAGSHDGKRRGKASESPMKLAVGAMQQAVETDQNIKPGWAQLLVERFQAEIEGASSGAFLATLDGLLRQVVKAEGKVSQWQGVISALSHFMLPTLKSNEQLLKAQSLWHQGRVSIQEITRKSQARQLMKQAQQQALFQAVSQTLVTTLDVDGLTQIIGRQLPLLGIEYCYLALYDNSKGHQPEGVPERSRMVLAYYPGSSRSLVEPGGSTFRTRELAPAGSLPQERYTLVVEPLYFQDQQFGYACFDMSLEGTLYEQLRGQISSALQGARLVQHVEERAVQIQTAAQVSSVISSILSPEELCKQIVALVNERFNLYYTGLFLIDQTGAKTGEPNQWAVLQAGTGEAGQQMLAKGHKLEIGDHSMIGRCILKKQACIALDVGTEAHRFSNPLLPSTRSEVALPLVSRGEVLGAMTVQSEKETAFSQEDVTILQTMADQLANAISNAQLFEEVQRRAVELHQAKEDADGAKEQAEKARHEAETANRTLEAQMWQTTGQGLLNERMRGEQDIPTLARNIIQQLCQYLDVQSGALYIMGDDEATLKLAGVYAQRENLPEMIPLGHTLLGESALEKRAITVNLPDHYLAMAYTSRGELIPQHQLVTPFVYEDRAIGVVNLESFSELTAAKTEFLNKTIESVAIAFLTAQARARVNELYAKTRQQAEELQAQEEELRATNEELEAQTESLRNSEAKLRQNQTALEAANADLEEKAHILQEQQAELDRQNQVLRDAQQELERKADELSLASKYKSEFLANMSHELRTPLNSMLILSGMLVKNEEGNLTPDQVESAQVIYSGGNDLLNLINEILDLAKVEAGKMEFRFAAMPWEYLVSRMKAQFEPLSQRKGLQFITRVADDLPPSIVTDEQRLAQIVKNLLSNAFKFTENGSISLAIERAGPNSGFDPAQFVAVNVTDTGIGMTPEQQKVVFEAFTQADGSTSRQYGGTGLGLTITREMTHRLGGKVGLSSEKGKGSTFTIYLPVKGAGEQEAGEKGIGKGEQPRAASDLGRNHQFSVTSHSSSPTPSPLPPLPSAPSIPDDRATLTPADQLLLIVEDDPSFAKIVLDYAHRKGFKAIAAPDGESAMQLLQTHTPQAVVLDLRLPRMSGWEVLDRIKNNPDTRHIPIHIMSGEEEDLTAFQHGAIGFLTKPVSHEDLDNAFTKIEQLITAKIKSLLLVEDDDNLRKSVRKLLEGNDIAITEASLGQTALEKLTAQHFDCMILDLTLPDMTGFELLNRMHNDESIPKCPVIVYTGKELTPEENHELLKYADSVIVKGVKSPERLLDETALFLHRVIAQMPEDKQRTIRRLHTAEAVLEGKQILLVDDDTRNAFALSKLLADKGMKMHIAPSGLKALEALEKAPSISLVLTDIMMPGMDGYELIKRIRGQSQFRSLPIVALTAKAMKGDREKCIDAGANDYLSKPIDPDRLFSMLRVWLSRE